MINTSNNKSSIQNQEEYFLDQEWKDICFLHWEVDKNILSSFLPNKLNLDLYDNKAYVGLIPFKMCNVSPRWAFPVPFISTFPEFNIRTYVKYKKQKGVFFITLDAQSIITRIYAPLAFGLPYKYSRGNVKREGNVIHWNSKRFSGQYELEGHCEASGQKSLSKSDSIENFFLERYCLFTEHNGLLKQAFIYHEPWIIQKAKAKILKNSFLEKYQFGISNIFKPTYCHTSKGTKVKASSINVCK